jgi:hypothetical protein
VSDARAAESPADEHLREQREEVAIETTAMAAAYNALQPLGPYARARALHWLARALESSVDVPF